MKARVRDTGQIVEVDSVLYAGLYVRKDCSDCYKPEDLDFNVLESTNATTPVTNTGSDTCGPGLGKIAARHIKEPEELTEYMAMTDKNIDWEQRRYEVTLALIRATSFPSYTALSGNQVLLASYFVNTADEIIKGMRKKNDTYRNNVG